MICRNPKTLYVDGKEQPIDYDAFAVLDILMAMKDPDLSPQEKNAVTLSILYPDFEKIKDIPEALKKAMWFIDVGQDFSEAKNKPTLMDWEQDFNIIAPAVNEVLGYDVCDTPQVHWWTFVRAYMQIFQRENSLFGTVVTIREKKKKHKKLESYEREFYKENKEIIELKKTFSAEEKAFLDSLT